MQAVFNIDSPIGTFPCTLWLQPKDSSDRSPFVIMNQETLIAHEPRDCGDNALCYWQSVKRQSCQTWPDTAATQLLLITGSGRNKQHNVAVQLNSIWTHEVMQTTYFMTQHRRFCNSNNTAPLASWNNVPQSIICGDDAAVPLPHNPPHALAMLYCYTILYSNASVTIICRLIVSKWEIRFQVIIGYAAPFSLIPFLSCPYSLISFLLTLNSSQNLLLSILMMGHSRVAFGDVKGKTSIPFLDILPLSLSLSLFLSRYLNSLFLSTTRYTLRYLH